MKPKPCRHTMAADYNAQGVRVARCQAVYRRCTPMWGGCGEYIPWGPANDGSMASPATREVRFAILPEIRAAELAALMEEHIFFSMVSNDGNEHRGWSLASGHASGDEYRPPGGVDEEAGWLSYFIVHHGILIAADSDEAA